MTMAVSRSSSSLIGDIMDCSLSRSRSAPAALSSIAARYSALLNPPVSARDDASRSTCSDLRSSWRSRATSTDMAPSTPDPPTVLPSLMRSASHSDSIWSASSRSRVTRASISACAASSSPSTSLTESACFSTAVSASMRARSASASLDSAWSSASRSFWFSASTRPDDSSAWLRRAAAAVATAASRACASILASASVSALRSASALPLASSESRVNSPLDRRASSRSWSAIISIARDSASWSPKLVSFSSSSTRTFRSASIAAESLTFMSGDDGYSLDPPSIVVGVRLELARETNATSSSPNVTPLGLSAGGVGLEDEPTLEDGPASSSSSPLRYLPNANEPVFAAFAAAMAASLLKLASTLRLDPPGVAPGRRDAGAAPMRPG